MNDIMPDLLEAYKNWENITQALFCVHRLKVDGGWIYCIEEKHPVFVPDIDLTRYQAHMRDAYKKGYLDGHADSKQGINAINE